MSKPIYDKEFWKSRLNHARKIDKLYYSVAADPRLPKINEIHYKITRDNIARDQTVLDIGCGYGRISPWFKKKQYTGIDFIKEFIDIANEKYDQKFVLGDFRKMPFEDNSFDWGLMVSIEHMIKGNKGGEEWEQVLKEAKRVCHKLLILEYGEPEKYKVL